MVIVRIISEISIFHKLKKYFLKQQKDQDGDNSSCILKLKSLDLKKTSVVDLERVSNIKEGKYLMIFFQTSIFCLKFFFQSFIFLFLLTLFTCNYFDFCQMTEVLSEKRKLYFFKNVKPRFKIFHDGSHHHYQLNECV